MAIILPRRYTQQPQGAYVVDWSNPITRGLIDVFDLRGIPRSVLLGTSPTFVGVNPVFGSPFVQGRSLDALGGYGAVIFKRTDAAYAPLAQTQVFLGSISSFEAKYSGIIGASWSSGANNSLFLQYYGAAGSYILYAGGTVGGWPATFSMPIGTPFVLSLDGIAGAQHLFINGSIAATATMADVSSSGTNSWFHLFSERSGSASYLTMGTAALALQFGRVLSAAEHASVAQNPWQIFKAPPRRIWVAAAGGTTYANSLTEAATAADALTNAATFPNAFTEAGSAADALNSTATFAATLSEAGTAADALVSALAVHASLTESGTAADALSAAFTAVSAIAEAASALDAYTTSLTAVNALTESGTATDSVSTGSVYLESLAEAATATDAISAAAVLRSALTEAGVASDAIASAWQTFASLLEAGTATDSVTNGQAYVEALTESGTATDALASALNAVGALSEAAYAADALQSSVALQSALNEAAAAIDALATQVVFAGLSLIEAGAASDALVGIVTGAGQFSSDPRFVVQSAGRTFTVQSAGRTFTVQSAGRTFIIRTDS